LSSPPSWSILPPAILREGGAMALLVGLALYAAAGVAVAAAFVAFGVTRVQPMPVSVGARVLIFPGAAALWPYVLIRWLKSVR
jgi:hypothetical protein